jgi:hypothetical protein
MKSKRTELNQLIAELVQERESYVPHWQDINKHVRPRSAKFCTKQGGRGDKRNQSIINNTATMSSETLASGMMSGVTSPARPWFKLSTGDPELDKIESVKTWLHDVAISMREVFAKSNLYTELPLVYADLGDYGISAMTALENDDSTVRFQHMPIGSYAIATDEDGRVDTIVREWQMTVRQLVQKFGKENCSAAVQAMYDNNQMGQWIEVAHIVHRNKDHDPKKLSAKHKKYCSIYMERSGNGRSEESITGFLRESGFDEFPVMCPRWSVTGEDPYGNSPAMNALGDIKALQVYEKRAAQMIDKGANPPMSAPSSLRNQRASLLPGDVTYVDVNQGQQGFQPVYEPNPTWLTALEQKILKHETRIKRAFYEDLFLMLANMDGVQPRNQLEIAERKEEKLLQLGPVMDRLNDELFDPLIDRTFDIMVKNSIPDWNAGNPGMLPIPPDELQNVKLKVEYTSIMAQAMKKVALGDVERFAGFMGNLAQGDPSVMDRWDLDETAKEYHDGIGLPPKIIRSDDEVDAIRQQRAQAQKAAQAVDMAKTSSEAAKNVAQTPMDGDNALARIIQNMQGATA